MIKIPQIDKNESSIVENEKSVLGTSLEYPPSTKLYVLIRPKNLTGVPSIVQIKYADKFYKICFGGQQILIRILKDKYLIQFDTQN